MKVNKKITDPGPYNLRLKKKEKKAPSAKQQAASLNMNTIK